MKLCESCGNENPDSVFSCEKCGDPLTEIAVSDKTNNQTRVAVILGVCTIFLALTIVGGILLGIYNKKKINEITDVLPSYADQALINLGVARKLTNYGILTSAFWGVGAITMLISYFAQ